MESQRWVWLVRNAFGIVCETHVIPPHEATELPASARYPRGGVCWRGVLIAREDLVRVK